MRKKIIFIFLTLVILLVGDANKSQCISEVLLSEDKFKIIKDELNIIEKYYDLENGIKEKFIAFILQFINSI